MAQCKEWCVETIQPCEIAHHHGIVSYTCCPIFKRVTVRLTERKLCLFSVWYVLLALYQKNLVYISVVLCIVTD